MISYVWVFPLVSVVWSVFKSYCSVWKALFSKVWGIGKLSTVEVVYKAFKSKEDDISLIGFALWSILES